MKKAISIFTAFFMLLTCMVTPNMTAYAANISLSVSKTSVQIGDSVTVTVTIPQNASGPINVELSNDVLSFSSSSAKELGVNGRYISISMGKYGLEGTNKVTLTFKAKTSGSVKISASHGDIFDNDSFEPVQLGSASATVTVENKATTPEPEKSGDNSLASLKLSKGTLSPKFKYSVTKYTATVDYDVTKVVVSAKTSNAKATIESITGDGTVNLKVGKNTIEIVVKAENGVKAKYTIVVTRKEKPASETPEPQPSESESNSQSETTTPPPVNEALQWNGEQLYVVDKIPTENVPKDFESTSLVVNGQQIQGLSFGKGDLKVLYLNNTNGAGSLYVYDEEQQSIYPFIKITSEQSYVMVLVPNEEKDPAPAGFESCTFSIEGKGVVNAYQLKEKTEDTTTSWNLFGAETFYAAPAKASEFYLIYCMNNNGEKGWYLYDIVEETFQRYLAVENSIQVGGDVTDDTEDSTQNNSSNNTSDELTKLEKELKTAKMTQYIVMGVAVVLTIIVIVLIVLLVMKKRSQEDDFFDGYEDDEDYVDDEEDDEVEVEFYNMEERIVNQTVESEKTASDKKEDAGDLEFIDFE